MGLAKLFGIGGKTTENISEVLKDSAKSTFTLIDEAFHTDQEKSEAQAKATDAYLRLWELTTKENSGTAEARRWLLHKVTDFVLWCAAISIFISILGVAFPEYSKESIAAVDVIFKIIDGWKIGWAFVSGISFYYITHAVKGISGK